MNQQSIKELDINDWQVIENRLSRIISYQARIHVKRAPRGTIEVEDLEQEGRIELFLKLKDYVPKRGSLEQFSSTILSNFFDVKVRQLLRQKRMPWVEVLVNNEWKKTPVVPTSSCEHSELLEDKKTPLNNLINKQSEIVLQKAFIEDLKSNMNENGLNILNMLLENGKPKVNSVSDGLSLRKNIVDNANFKIKKVFTELAVGNEYKELFGDLVSTKGWPKVYAEMSNETNKKFIKKTLKEKKLNSKCLNITRESTNNKKFQLLVGYYSWGNVIVLKSKKMFETIISIGKFNARTGLVTGPIGPRMSVSSSYQKLKRKVSQCQA